jgi:hypothetical protein
MSDFPSLDRAAEFLANRVVSRLAQVAKALRVAPLKLGLDGRELAGMRDVHDVRLPPRYSSMVNASPAIVLRHSSAVSSKPPCTRASAAAASMHSRKVARVRCRIEIGIQRYPRTC